MKALFSARRQLDQGKAGDRSRRRDAGISRRSGVPAAASSHTYSYTRSNFCMHPHAPGARYALARGGALARARGAPKAPRELSTDVVDSLRASEYRRLYSPRDRPQSQLLLAGQVARGAELADSVPESSSSARVHVRRQRDKAPHERPTLGEHRWTVRGSCTTCRKQ